MEPVTPEEITHDFVIKPDLLVYPNLIETEPVQSAFGNYLDKRVAESVGVGSVLFRQHLDSDSASYKKEVLFAHQELAATLQLDEDFYEDPVNLEIMLVISDSWALSRNKDPDGTQDKTEKDFLFTAARILAGSKSGFNRDAHEGGEERADKFVDDPASKEAEKNRAEFKSFRENADTQKSAELMEMIRETGDKSILASVRKRLGIEDLSSEDPFGVMVLDAYRYVREHEGQKKWEEVVNLGGNMAAFVADDPQDNVPIIFVSSEDYASLVEEDSLSSEDIKRRIGHEYAHTQRKVRFGHETELGRIFDERMVVRASGNGSYSDTAVVFRTLERLVPNDGDQIFNLIDACAKSSENSADLLKYITNNFGPRATLLLLSVMPRNYGHDNGITQIPEIRMDPKFRMSDLVQELISARIAIDPQAKDRFLEILVNSSDKYLEQELYILQDAGIRMPDPIQNLIDERARALGLI